MISTTTSNALDVPNIIAGALAGGLVGFALGIVGTYFVDWLRRGRVKFLGFKRYETSFGILFGFRFKVIGSLDPGLCCLQIKWPSGRVFGKWDETPNPLQSDDLTQFRPEPVPATFYQPLFIDTEYSIPVIVADLNGNCDIFSGWWFGRDRGYGPNPRLPSPQSEQIRLTLLGGGGLSYSKEFRVSDILKAPL
jgi:hypothetical protein